MVENFEEQTHELTEYEKKVLLPAMLKGFRTKVGEKNAVTSTEIVTSLKAKGFKVDASRIRKVVNHIRINNLIFNLIATSKGYYIAESIGECQSFIRSLDQRANAIISVRDAMSYQLEITIKK